MLTLSWSVWYLSASSWPPRNVAISLQSVHRGRAIYEVVHEIDQKLAARVFQQRPKNLRFHCQPTFGSMKKKRSFSRAVSQYVRDAPSDIAVNCCGLYILRRVAEKWLSRPISAPSWDCCHCGDCCWFHPRGQVMAHLGRQHALCQLPKLPGQAGLAKDRLGVLVLRLS